MKVEPLVSICIPTRNRPELLRQALESCFVQSYRPLEIVIGDDSEGSETQALVEAFRGRNVPIVHRRNQPPQGQAGNVNELFRSARGARLVLLHDDDLLLPGAVEILATCWDLDRGITAAFGKQNLISESAEPLDDGKLNKRCYRTSEFAGIRLRPVESALLGQFPNDGYMVLAATARKVGYRGKKGDMINRWCDYDFGVRLACHADRFYYLDRYTAVNRMTTKSISRTALPREICHNTIRLIKGLDLPSDAEWARLRALERINPILLGVYADENDRRAIMDLYTSACGSGSYRISLRGVYHLALMISPELVRRVVRHMRRSIGR
jgi:glycosyltransferase involved in cell wall biosynthesis